MSFFTVNLMLSRDDVMADGVEPTQTSFEWLIKDVFSLMNFFFIVKKVVTHLICFDTEAGFPEWWIRIIIVGSFVDSSIFRPKL